MKYMLTIFGEEGGMDDASPEEQQQAIEAWDGITQEMKDKGVFEAVSTDAAILAGYKAKDPEKYQHWDIGLDTTEAWGVNVGENPALLKLVNLALYRSREDPEDNRWEEAFDANFATEEEVNRPAPIAVDQQPAVQEPDVRQWPWERV